MGRGRICAYRPELAWQSRASQAKQGREVLIPAMKHVTERPFADPQAAARKLIELAASIEPVQDGRIHIEKINYPFVSTLKGSGPEFGAGIRCAIEKGWLELHESGTYVRLLAPGNDLMALR
jgi:hypothetical protein